MTTNPAPVLLTQEIAIDTWNNDTLPLVLEAPIQALAAGRTRCVQMLSEAEHRERFERDLELSGINWALMGRDAAGEYRDVRIMHRWGSWLACAKAMGAVADTGGQR